MTVHSNIQSQPRYYLKGPNSSESVELDACLAGIADFNFSIASMISPIF